MAGPVFTAYSEVPGKPGLYRFERGSAPPIELYGRPAEQYKRQIDQFKAMNTVADNAHASPQGGLSFENYDDSGRTATDAPRASAPRGPISLDAYDAKGRTGAPDPASTAPRTSPGATLARRAAGTLGNALIEPVKMGARVLRNVVDTRGVRNLDANTAVDDAESLARDEPVAATRARRLGGEGAYHEWAAAGDIAGEAGAGLVQGAALKAAPAVRNAWREGAFFERPPGLTDAEWAARNRGKVTPEPARAEEGGLLRDERGALRGSAKEKAQSRAVADREAKRGGLYDGNNFWRVQDADAPLASGHRSMIGSGPAREEGTSALHRGSEHLLGEEEVLYRPNTSWKVRGSERLPDGRTVVDIEESAPAQPPKQRSDEFLLAHPDYAALDDYVGSSTMLNRELREQGLGMPARSYEGRSKALEKAERLNRVLSDAEKAGHAEPGLTYRGVDLPPGVADKWEETGYVGNHSFWSTSKNEGKARLFTGDREGREPVVLRIHGRSGVPLGTAGLQGGVEEETLFGRGKRWKVIGSSRGDDGMRIMDLEQVDTVPKGVRPEVGANDTNSDRRAV